MRVRPLASALWNCRSADRNSLPDAATCSASVVFGRSTENPGGIVDREAHRPLAPAPVQPQAQLELLAGKRLHVDRLEAQVSAPRAGECRQGERENPRCARPLIGAKPRRGSSRSERALTYTYDSTP